MPARAEKETGHPSAARPRGIDAKAYNEFVSHARLSRIRLLASKFKVAPTAFDNREEDWIFEVSDTLSEWSLDCEELVLHGQYDYEVACLEKNRKPVKLTASYLAAFKISAACNEEPAREYLRRVGRYSCYPYFRAHFALTTEASGLRLPPLPTIWEPARIVERGG